MWTVRKMIATVGISITLATSLVIIPYMNTAVFCSSISSTDSTVEEDVQDATQIIEKILKAQYEEKEEELSNIIHENDYDETLTFQSFYNQENPLKDIDYLDLISLYSSIKTYCLKNNISIKTGLSTVQFLNMEVKKKSIKETTPLLVEKYEKTDNGYYRKSGNQVINEETTLPVYKEVKDGLYEKTEETKTYKPEKEAIYYGDVTLTMATDDEIADTFGIKVSEVEDDYAKRFIALNNIINPVTLTQSTFINLRKDFDSVSDISLVDLTKEIQSCTPVQKTVLLAAESLVGQIPYQWGGKASKAGYDSSWWTYDENGKQKGLDCSGFVQWVYMTAGYNSEVTSKMISTSTIASNFETTTKDELEPGDFGLLYDGTGEGINHVGIYIGNDYFIHCSSGSNTVVISKFPFKVFKKATQMVNNNVDNNADDTYNDSSKYTNGESLDVIPVADTVTEDLTAEDKKNIYLLSELVQHEAGGQGYNGWVAVAEVVKNRVNSSLYPNTYSDVIYQDGQFSGISEIKDIKPSDKLLSVVTDVYMGKVSIINNSSVLYFRNPQTTSGIKASVKSDWGSHTWYCCVNDHAFYLQ